MLGVTVPTYVFMGDSVELLCNYDMQMDKLYSVTWYKDNEEFYRYVPTSNHLKHSYSMDGITVDVSTYFIYFYGHSKFEVTKIVNVIFKLHIIFLHR